MRKARANKGQATAGRDRPCGTLPDALLARYLPCRTVEVSNYIWTHGGEPDELDVTGRGTFSFQTGEGTLQLGLLSPRLLEEGLEKSRAESVRRILRFLSETSPVSLSSDDRAVLGWHPRWFTEALRGVCSDPPEVAPSEEFVWKGATDLFVARDRSRWRLDLGLPWRWRLPWSPQRAWVHREPVRVHARAGALFIAVQEPDFGAWHGVRFECDPEAPDGNESGSRA